MTKIALAGVLFLASFGDVCLAQAEAHELAARVNGAPVHRADVERLLTDPQLRAQLEGMAVADASGEPLTRVALRELVHRTLLLQEAERRRLVVTDDETDQAISALRRRFTDLKSFGAWMAERGLDDRTLAAAAHSRMLIARVTAKLVEGVEVDDRRLLDYYERHAKELRTEDLWIQVIVVKERASAEDIQAALARGEDFGALARKHSLGRYASRGGDMGWVNSEALRSPVREAVESLEAGKAIGPLQRNDAEFLIVRLQERRAGRLKTFSEARAGIERLLVGREQHELIRRWLVDQEKKSKIELFAAR